MGDWRGLRAQALRPDVRIGCKCLWGSEIRILRICPFCAPALVNLRAQNGTKDGDRPGGGIWVRRVIVDVSVDLSKGYFASLMPGAIYLRLGVGKRCAEMLSDVSGYVRVNPDLQT